MGLSQDQKAMLRLLAQREQGYEDLAALMGLSVDEVRVKVKEALDQLEAEGKEAPPAPVTEEPVEPPTAAAEAPKPAAPAAPSAPKRPKPARPKPSLPSDRRARAAIAVGALAVVALVVVLLVSGGGDSGDSGGNDATTAASTTTKTARDVTSATLDPVDGGDAKGLAVFGRVKDSLALQVEASGLEPTADGESYTIWLYESRRKMLPLASTTVGDDGKIGAQVEVPTEVLGYLANETFNQIDISRTTDATLKAALSKATREKEAPIYTGDDVLRGKITGPIIGAANKK